MSDVKKEAKIRRLVCYRYNPEHCPQSYYSVYDIPFVLSMTILDMLDYVVRNLDATLAYIVHSRCNQGLCARCILKINGKSRLACLETCDEEIVIVEPVDKKRVSKDLVTKL